MTEYTSSNNNRNRCLQIYHLYKLYYNYQLWENDWSEIYTILAEHTQCYESEQISKGLLMLKNLSPEKLTQAKEEFTRLFIGPGELLAPPYESVYRSQERVLMQATTLCVRNLYARAGLSVKDFNRIPDDYLVYELEFICFLLGKLQLNETTDEVEELYQLFLDNHFFKWVGKHCDDVIKYSHSCVCTGLAIILKEFIEIEKLRKGGKSNGKNI